MQTRIELAGVHLDHPFILAPMAGVTDSPMRIISRQHGAAMVWSEMVSSEALIRRHRKTMEMLSCKPEERPIAAQIAGAKPESLAKAARIVSELGEFAFIDINMACPIKKIVRTGAGVALMRDPERARDIVASVKAATSLPVTVKIRSGWNRSSINAVEFAQMLESSGAACIALHPRTGEQLYSGTADWSLISRTVQAVKIPVIGSGDIRIPEDALRMHLETGCQAIMVARGALGNPWFFRQCLSLWQGTAPKPPTPDERIAVMMEHISLAEKYLGDRRAHARLKKHLPWYSHGLPEAAEFRRRLMLSQSVDEMRQILADSALNW